MIITGFSFYDIGISQVVADGLAGVDDEKILIVPVSVNELLQQGWVAFDFVVVPFQIFGTLFGVFFGMFGAGQAPIDKNRMLVFVDPGLLGFHEVLGVIGTEFLGIFSQQFFVAIRPGHEFAAVLDPADAVPVGAFVGIEIMLVCMPAAEQERDAVVAAGDNNGNVAMEAADAVAAQAVAQQDGVVGLAGFVGGFVQLFLDLAAQDIRRIMQALGHQHDIHDILAAGRT